MISVPTTSTRGPRRARDGSPAAQRQARSELSHPPNSFRAALSSTQPTLPSPGPTIALALANARYWTTVAPRVRAQLARWETAARTIPHPQLRAVALGKLREENMNAKTAATLATLAPRARRTTVAEAIVALQVLYDHLDALDERAVANGSRDEGELFAALTCAIEPIDAPVSTRGASGTGRRHNPRGSGNRPQAVTDRDYTVALADTVRESLAGLPRAAEVAPVLRQAAERCGRGQTLIHRAGILGTEPLRAWAQALEPGGPLRWQELLAGASASVLSLHALIAAAADERTTAKRAQAIDRAYLAIGALTMLDSVIDHEHDLIAGQRGFVHHYDGDRELLALRGAAVAREARARASVLPDGGHHVMTLAGVVAYYACAPGADPEIVAPIRRELEPAITPAIALMRAWRTRTRGGRTGAQTAPSDARAGSENRR